MLHIKRSDLVLEIGSGNRPRKRANILCDKYIDDNTERSSQENIVIDRRPFLVADGLALPFKDRSFDYVFTSHILEHVEDPHKFIAELERVAAAGYIETPSELAERIFGWPFHRWIVRLEGDTIVMRPKARDCDFGDHFHRMYAEDHLFGEFVDSHMKDFYVQYEWKESIKLRIEQDSSPAVHFSSPSSTVQTKSPWKMMQISWARSVVRLVLRLIRHLRKFES